MQMRLNVRLWCRVSDAGCRVSLGTDLRLVSLRLSPGLCPRAFPPSHASAHAPARPFTHAALAAVPPACAFVVYTSAHNILPRVHSSLMQTPTSFRLVHIHHSCVCLHLASCTSPLDYTHIFTSYLQYLKMFLYMQYQLEMSCKFRKKNGISKI